MIFTGLDVILLIVMLVSALLAMVRGLTREVLSIASWGLAAVATLVLFPQFQAPMRAQLQPTWLADIVLAFGIFLLVLIVVSFVTMRISDFILDSRIGVLDRSLGFLFGLGRGLVLVVIAHLFFAWLVPEESQPEWIRDARSRPLLESTGAGLIAMLPEDPETAILDRLKQGLDRDESPPAEPDQAGERQGAGGTQGYDEAERQRLDQLLQQGGGATRSQ